MMIKAVSIICLILMIALFVYIIGKIVYLKKGKKLKYIKSFKKGKFAIIAIISFPLFLIGNLYSSTEIWQSILMSIRSSIEMLVLKYDFKTISSLYANCILFRSAIVIAYILSFLNAIMFAFAVFGQNIITHFRKVSLYKRSKKVIIAVGFNDINYSIIKGFNGAKALIGTTDDKTYDKLFSEGIIVINKEKTDLYDFTDKHFKNIINREINIIVNDETDEINLNNGILVCDLVKKYIQDNIINIKNGINGYVFGSGASETSFYDLESVSKGKVRFINKQKMIARSFTDHYPITKYMTSEQIDYASGTIKKDVDINVVLIGFGATNQEILSTIIPNNCLITRDGNKLQDKEINYYVYDKKSVLENRNYNFNYRYFKTKEAFDENKYLPLPVISDNINFETLDINDSKFFDTLINIVKINSYNYFIISLGDSMINLDIAEKLSSLFEFNHAHIFTKINDENLLESLKKTITNPKLHIFYDNIYSESGNKCIFQEETEKMAIKRHISYSDIYASGEDTDVVANKLWFEKFTRTQRDSNIFSCLNIRTKLNLLGFDYENKSSENSDAANEFKKQYFTGTKLVLDNDKIDYRNTISDNGSIRQNFAFQEHSRWNKYMISRGYTPASLEEFKKFSTAQLKSMHKHINLTTFDGLYKYADLIMKRDNVDFYTADVIKYDYQILDNVADLLDLCDMKIIRKGD